MYPAKSERVRWIERKEGAVMLNPKTGLCHKANEIATIIWQNCDGTKTIDQISKIIINKYRAERKKITKDVYSIVNYFKRAGLIKLYKSSNRFHLDLNKIKHGKCK